MLTALHPGCIKECRSCFSAAKRSFREVRLWLESTFDHRADLNRAEILRSTICWRSNRALKTLISLVFEFSKAVHSWERSKAPFVQHGPSANNHQPFSWHSFHLYCCYARFFWWVAPLPPHTMFFFSVINLYHLSLTDVSVHANMTWNSTVSRLFLSRKKKAAEKRQHATQTPSPRRSWTRWLGEKPAFDSEYNYSRQVLWC